MHRKETAISMYWLELLLISFPAKVNNSEIKRVTEMDKKIYIYIVSCRGASQLGGSLSGIPPGYKANKL